MNPGQKFHHTGTLKPLHGGWRWRDLFGYFDPLNAYWFADGIEAGAGCLKLWRGYLTRTIVAGTHFFSFFHIGRRQQKT